MRDFLYLSVRADELILEVRGTGEETVEQVDHIPVGVRRDEVLAVKASCHLEAQALRSLVLDADAGLRAELGQRAVILDAERGIDDPRSPLPLVVEVARQFRSILGLFHRHAQGVEGPEIRTEPHRLDAVARLIVAQHVLEVQAEIEAVDLTESVGQPLLLEVDAVP